MSRIAHRSGLALAACSAAFAILPCQAANDPLPAAAAFYAFVGNWHGEGELVEPGQAPAKVALSLSCSKEASGWAVACRLSAKNKSLTIAEFGLMGVDAVTGKNHWYAVSNQGETHDHLTEWLDPTTMQANYAWEQEGRQMLEEVVFVFAHKGTLNFRSVTSADGKPAGEFSGTLTR